MPFASPATMSEDERNVTLQEGELVVKKDDWDKLMEEIRSAKAGRDKYKRERDEARQMLKEEQEENNQLKQRVKALKTDKRALTDELTQVQASLSKRGKKAKAKALIKEDVAKEITRWMKTGPFRNAKFIKNTEHKNALIKASWEALKDSLRLEEGPTPMNLESWTEIYGDQMEASMSDCRQYIQSQTQQAAKGKSSLVLCMNRVLLPLIGNPLTLDWRLVSPQSGILPTTGTCPRLRRFWKPAN